jgi:hypothetical protein
MSLVPEEGVKASGTKSGTSSKKSKLGVSTLKPPAVEGHEWRNIDTGWVLWKRFKVPGENGKMKTRRKYVKFYPYHALEVMYGSGHAGYRRVKKGGSAKTIRTGTSSGGNG